MVHARAYYWDMKSSYNRTQDERREQMLRELMSNLANLVESGDLTDQEANDWYNRKADQWAQGLS